VIDNQHTEGHKQQGKSKKAEGKSDGQHGRQSSSILTPKNLLPA
jgi:hypothetical protein